MQAKKYNYDTRNFDMIEVPEKACVNCMELNKVVQCASCGKEVKYVNTITSNHIRTLGGFGYAICEDCSNKEKELIKEHAIKLKPKKVE